LIFKGKFSWQAFRRFGIVPKRVWQAIQSKEIIWIHAVSLGEVATCKPLIKNLSLKFPQRIILVTTVTNTGMALAKRLSQGNVVSCYMPFDLSFLIRPFIKKINLRILILLETELWPNLLYYIGRGDIPILVLNARLSDRSFGRYRLFSWFIRRISRPVKMFCAQSDLDRDRFLQIGIEKYRLKLTGNMKFDISEELDKIQLREFDTLKTKISLNDGDFLIVAGSTHNKEEEYILDIFIRLKKKFPNLRLLIAPRHLERVDYIEGLIKNKGLRPYRFSRLNLPLPEDVIILDAIGKLPYIYSLASLVFVGGSLVPIGGHNILEPAFFAKPIIVGPYMHNFRQITQVFLSNNALAQARDAQDLKSKMEELISDKNILLELGQAAKQVLSSRQGATLANLEIIENIIE
jgi:3-deoxy-D-manno-octulosonic-acid transferase